MSRRKYTIHKAPGDKLSDRDRLDKTFSAETYYTRAYASYEKGVIENCN